MFEKLTRVAFVFFMPLYMLSEYLFMRGINTYMFLYHPLRLILLIKVLSLMLTKNDSSFIKLMTIYFFYCAFSVVLYEFNDAPINGYVSALQPYLYPMIFVWLGYGYSNDEKFNKMYLYSCLACFLIGFYLYFTMPSYYMQFLYDVQTTGWTAKEGVTDSSILAFARFSSFFGYSYAISYFSIPALSISLGYTLYKNTEISKKLLYFMSIVSFVAAMLCMQRAAMAYSVAVLLFYGYYSLKRNNSSRLFVVFGVVVALVVVVLGAVGTLDRFSEISGNLLEQLSRMDFSEAMEERTFQYSLSDRATWWSYIVGLGMGSCGGIARSVGLAGVTDGEYVKMFYEMGFLGTSIFALIMITTILRGLKHLRLYYMELIIVVYFLAAGLGSNSLYMNMYCAMFWYSLGRIWNKQYYQIKKGYIFENGNKR